MSRGARWILGLFCLLFAWIFEISVDPTSPHPFFVHALTLFCVTIAIACFSAQLRGPAVRTIGLAVFTLAIAYLAYEIWLLKHRESSHDGNLLGSIKFFFVFGLPSFYVAVHGVYPSWGQGAGAFDGRRKKGRTEDFLDSE